jgi:hypothetical protein
VANCILPASSSRKGIDGSEIVPRASVVDRIARMRPSGLAFLVTLDFDITWLAALDFLYYTWEMFHF